MSDGVEHIADEVSAGMKILGRVIAAFGCGSGVVVPLISLFGDNAPPLFPGTTALLTGGGSIAVFVIAVQSHMKVRRLRFWAITCIVLAIVLYTMHELTARHTTVLPSDQPEAGRMQIGFGMSRWSLTEDTVNFLEAARTGGEVELVTPDALMMARGGYEFGPDVVWKTWTIWAAGVLLMVLFASSFVAWTYGWGLMAKYLMSPQRSGPGEEKDKHRLASRTL